MDFHVEFNPKPFTKKIAHHHKLMLIGSCFTENIGDKLIAHKFSVHQNPNGILFNPVSVAEAIDNYVSDKQISTDSLFYLNESFHSWQHHSRFSSPDAAIAVEQINKSTTAAKLFLQKADFLMITLGSAWVYELTEHAMNATVGKVAANNHKAPANWFNRKLLKPQELDAILGDMISRLQVFNPTLKIIFTISPVRHLREGFVENNRSKAALIHAVHQATELYSDVFYFPAYELIIDDLRDYRFYAEDMVHPNYAATNYVWQKFLQTCIDVPSIELMKSIQEINSARAHKAFNPDSVAHKNFLASNYKKLLQLKEKFPYLNFDEEAAYFSKYIAET